MDHRCDFCGELLTVLESGGEGASPRGRFRCEWCGIDYRLDPGGTLFEIPE